MCDERTTLDAHLSRAPSRRAFAAMSAAALAACATSPPNAHAVAEQDVNIVTPDGEADAYFVHPASGRHPGVLMWPDIRGLRPAFRAMGKRLAESGYAVLVVNPYYRALRGAPLAPGESWEDPAARSRLISMARAFTPAMQASDGAAFVAWLDTQGAVAAGRKLGVAGYCMTGAFMMRTAAAAPERVGAGASFHGGGLATSAPDSPHLLAPQLRGGYLFAIAENDDAQEPDAKNVLRQAFETARTPAEIEVYPTQHGWCVLDSPVYDQTQADRAWARLLALFSVQLG